MKTNFTPEEMYEAYAEEMVKYLKQKFLIDSGFKYYFINNVEDYDFTEPEDAVEEVLRSYVSWVNPKKKNVRRVKLMSGIPHEVVKILSEPQLITMRDGEGTVDKFYSVDVVLKKEYEENYATVTFENYEDAKSLKKGKIFYR